MGPIAREIETRLRKALAPESLQVMDDSEKHRGHAGHDARGESHFTVKITSAAFEERSRVERQRMVNAALSALLAERVPALAIQARNPAETAAACTCRNDLRKHGPARVSTPGRPRIVNTKCGASIHPPPPL